MKKNRPAKSRAVLKEWGKRRGTIPQPSDPQSDALPIELLSPSEKRHIVYRISADVSTVIFFLFFRRGAMWSATGLTAKGKFSIMPLREPQEGQIYGLDGARRRRLHGARGSLLRADSLFLLRGSRRLRRTLSCVRGEPAGRRVGFQPLRPLVLWVP